MYYSGLYSTILYYDILHYKHSILYYTILYIYIYVYSKHIYIYICIHTSIHPSIHPYIHTYIHTYIHACVYIYIYMYNRADTSTAPARGVPQVQPFTFCREQRTETWRRWRNPNVCFVYLSEYTGGDSPLCFVASNAPKPFQFYGRRWIPDSETPNQQHIHV